MEEKDKKDIKKTEEKQDFEKELEEQRKIAEEYLAGWKRERADFVNFKRDEAERIRRTIELAEKDIVKDFLPILDSIYLLKKHNSQEIEGFLNIIKQISAFLDKVGVKEIDCLGNEFNPHLHEAVETVEGEQEVPTVLEELQKGYIMDDKIIRPAKVKVSIKK